MQTPSYRPLCEANLNWVAPIGRLLDVLIRTALYPLQRTFRHFSEKNNGFHIPKSRYHGSWSTQSISPGKKMV